MFVCVYTHSIISNSLQPHGLYIAHQAPLSIEFSRQEYWSRLPFPTLGDLPQREGIGIKPMFLTSPALAGRFFTTEPSGNPISRNQRVNCKGSHQQKTSKFKKSVKIYQAVNIHPKTKLCLSPLKDAREATHFSEKL